MSAQILEFRVKERPSRLQAMRWLAANNILYQKEIPGEIGPSLFHGWRFIRSTDGVVYFADCIHPGIAEDDLQQFKLYA